MPLPNISLVNSQGQEYNLTTYQGQVLLIVNTATGCHFSKQMFELETLYQTYKNQGLIVLGFPSNQFFQEGISNENMTFRCHEDFGTSFPLHEKIWLNGADTHPLYSWLKNEKPGFLGKSIKWNFTKFLINRQGQVVKRYGPTIAPQAIARDIEFWL